MSQRKCFIIQPLSDNYKRRCDETYKPAIEAAGLVPYRVDEDYHAKKLKISAIKEDIEKSAVCLADITENNPNVWYELGLADGHNIPVVLICEDAKREKLPFDVNQRDSYFYAIQSQGDWESLQQEITSRLKVAIQDMASEKAEIPATKSNDDSKDRFENADSNFSPSPLDPIAAMQEVGHLGPKDEEKFGDTDLHLLKILYYDCEYEDSIEETTLRKTLEQLGCSNMDITDAFNRLKTREMIMVDSATFISSFDSFSGNHWSLTEEGRAWCVKNNSLLREKAK